MSFSITRIVPAYSEAPSNVPVNFKDQAVGITPVLVGTAGKSLNWFGFNLYNPNASAVFLKFYNKATAPTVGTDVPVIVIHIPATSSVVLQGTDMLANFSAGLYVATTTGYLTADVGAPATGSLVQLTIMQ